MPILKHKIYIKIGYKSDQAKVETFRLLHFRLGYCGSDEEVLALTLVAIGAAESFCLLFCGKKVKANARLDGRKALSVDALIFNFLK